MVDEATVFMAGDMAESGGNISSMASSCCCGLRAMVAGNPGAGLNTGDGGLECKVGWLLLVEKVAEELRLGALCTLEIEVVSE